MPEALPTCRCGHDKTHHMVSARGRYTIWGWFALLIGVTARPKRVEYWCRRCGERADVTTDPDVLAKHC
jgi:hypothetical protein